MTTKTQIMSIFAITGILVGSIAISSTVFADYGSDSYKKKSDSNANLYVNSMSFDFNMPLEYDSCDAHAPPCVMIDPLNMENEFFIADPILQSTKTLIAVNVHEHDHFPTEIHDIFEYPECFIVTLANIDGINGILVECDNINDRLIDVTYSFTEPQSIGMNIPYDSHNDYDDQHDDEYKNYDGKFHRDDKS